MGTSIISLDSLSFFGLKPHRRELLEVSSAYPLPPFGQIRVHASKLFLKNDYHFHN